MLNLSYLALIGASLYAGFATFPFWTIVPLGVASVLLFFLARPQAASMGLREGGASYLLTMLVANVFLCAVPFFIGYLAGKAFV